MSKDIAKELLNLAKNPYVHALLSDFAVFFGIDTIKSFVKRGAQDDKQSTPKEELPIFTAFLEVTDSAKRKTIVQWFENLSNHDRKKVTQLKKETLDKLFNLTEDEIKDFVSLLGDSPLEALTKWAKQRDVSGDPPLPNTRTLLKQFGNWGRDRS